MQIAFSSMVQKTDFVLHGGDIFNYNYYLAVHRDFNCCEMCAYAVVVNGVTQATSIISSDEASLYIMHVDDALAAIYLSPTTHNSFLGASNRQRDHLFVSLSGW
jgi:hypothetical protein